MRGPETSTQQAGGGGKSQPAMVAFKSALRRPRRDDEGVAVFLRSAVRSYGPERVWQVRRKKEVRKGRTKKLR